MEKETEKAEKAVKEIPSAVSSLPPNKTPEHGVPSAGNTADTKKIEIKAVTSTGISAFGGGFDAFDFDDKEKKENTNVAAATPSVTTQKVRVCVLLSVFVSLCPCLCPSVRVCVRLSVFVSV